MTLLLQRFSNHSPGGFSSWRIIVIGTSVTLLPAERTSRTRISFSETFRLLLVSPSGLRMILSNASATSSLPGAVDFHRSRAEAVRAEPRAVDFYRNDRLAAVDGTDAVRPVRFATDTIYAVGVMLVRPGAPHAPRATVTRTRAVHLAPDYRSGCRLGTGPSRVGRVPCRCS